MALSPIASALLLSLLAAPTAPPPAPAPGKGSGSKAPADTKPAAPVDPSKLSAAGLIDGVVAAYGGKPALDGARALRMTGTVESPTRGKGELVRSLERPDRLKIDVRYAAAREVRLLDGPQAFQNGKPVAGIQAQAMALQAFRLDLPGLLGRLKDKARDLGPVEQGGVQTRSLGLVLPGGMEVVAFIDPATFHIVRSENSVGAGKEKVTFMTNYSDFRTEGGVLFPFAEENFAGKVATGVTKFEKIEVLTELPEATWKVEKIAGAPQQ